MRYGTGVIFRLCGTRSAFCQDFAARSVPMELKERIEKTFVTLTTHAYQEFVRTAAYPVRKRVSDSVCHFAFSFCQGVRSKQTCS